MDSAPQILDRDLIIARAVVATTDPLVAAIADPAARYWDEVALAMHDAECLSPSRPDGPEPLASWLERLIRMSKNARPQPTA